MKKIMKYVVGFSVVVITLLALLFIMSPTLTGRVGYATGIGPTSQMYKEFYEKDLYRYGTYDSIVNGQEITLPISEQKFWSDYNVSYWKKLMIKYRVGIDENYIKGMTCYDTIYNFYAFNDTLEYIKKIKYECSKLEEVVEGKDYPKFLCSLESTYDDKDFYVVNMNTKIYFDKLNRVSFSCLAPVTFSCCEYDDMHIPNKNNSYIEYKSEDLTGANINGERFIDMYISEKYNFDSYRKNHISNYYTFQCQDGDYFPVNSKEECLGKN